MEQINLKNYPERFALCGLPVVKVAVNFDSESCTLGDWIIEKAFSNFNIVKQHKTKISCLFILICIV